MDIKRIRCFYMDTGKEQSSLYLSKSRSFVGGVNSLLSKDERFPVNDPLVAEALLGIYLDLANERSNDTMKKMGDFAVAALQTIGGDLSKLLKKFEFGEGETARDVLSAVTTALAKHLRGDEVTVPNEPQAPEIAPTTLAAPLRQKFTPRKLGEKPVDVYREPEPTDDDENWRARAACLQTDPDTFFPEKGGRPTEAKKICKTCLVKEQCLQEAFAGDEYGIWGGTTETERRKSTRRRSR